MAKWLTYFALVLCCGISAGALSGAAAAADLVTTNPKHYANPGASMPSGSDSIFNRTKQARAGSRVVVRDDATLTTNWLLNPDLSRACNKRQFRQKRDQYLIGVVEGQTYGAAVGGHSSLYDPAKMAVSQVVYLFRGQGTTDCRVYHRTK